MIGKPGVTAGRQVRSVLLSFIFITAWLVFPAGLKAGGKKSYWIEVRSPHFTVDSNSDKQAAKSVARRLELIRETMTRAFVHTNQYKDPPLKVLAVNGRASLNRLLPNYFKKRGFAHPAGLFLESPMGDFIVLRTDMMRPHVFNPVYHEYTYFVMRRLLPNMPLWLSEGLAGLYSDTRVEKHVVLMGIADPHKLSILLWRPLIPIRTLLTVDEPSPYYHRWDKVGIFYSESWALTHYLMFLDASHGTHHLKDYERQVSQGADPVKTFITIFGPTKKLYNKLGIYVNHLAFPVFRLPVTEQTSSKDYSVRPLSWAEVDADKAELLLADGNRQDAEVLVRKSLKENPHLGLANALMSLLVLQNGSRAKAAAWAKKAIQFDPTDYHGYYFAALAMQGAPLNPASTALLEQDLEQAVKLQPGLAEPEEMLSDIYLTEKGKLDQALALALEAARNEPEENPYLINLEMVLLKQGRQAEAVTIEMQMLHRARTPKQEAMVRNDIGWALLQQNIAMSRANTEIHIAVQLDPKNADIQDSLGHLLKKEGHLTEARDAYQRALSIQPKLFSSLEGLGDVLLSQHNLNGAVTEYRKALAIAPNSAQAHYNLSRALKAEGDSAQATSELKAGRTLDPFDPKYQ